MTSLVCCVAEGTRSSADQAILGLEFAETDVV